MTYVRHFIISDKPTKSSNHDLGSEQLTTSEKPPIQIYNPESGIVAVEGSYSHLPQKSVLSVASLTLISGILCIALGIAHEVMLRDWKYTGIGCGILFAVTGILGIVSVYRRTKGRLLATGVLSIICCLSAASMGMNVVGYFCKGWERNMYRHKRSSESGEDDRHWFWSWRIYKVILGINIVFFIFCLLVFACCVALAVFTFKTVTSPKGNDEQRRGPVLTPVVSFPPSRDPNQLDTFNGN
jgi:MFS family permease